MSSGDQAVNEILIRKMSAKYFKDIRKMKIIYGLFPIHRSTDWILPRISSTNFVLQLSPQIRKHSKWSCVQGTSKMFPAWFIKRFIVWDSLNIYQFSFARHKCAGFPEKTSFSSLLFVFSIFTFTFGRLKFEACVNCKFFCTWFIAKWRHKILLKVQKDISLGNLSQR